MTDNDPAESLTPENDQFKIDVATRYLEDDSDPESDRFVFAYTITIVNEGDIPATLLTRHWVITHGNGRQQEVRGDGVVGEQPRIKPGDQMVTDDGDEFDTSIPEFLLSTPRTLH